MRNLHFDSEVVGVSAFSNLMTMATEDGTLFVINTQTVAIEKQMSLPTDSGAPGRPMWSCDGSFVWVPSGNMVYLMKPGADKCTASLDLGGAISQLFPHPKASCALVLMSDNRVLAINSENTDIGQVETPEDGIVSIVMCQDQLAIVTSSEITFIDPESLKITSTSHFEKRAAALMFADATDDFGIVLIWADGFWYRVSDHAKSTGTCTSANHVSLVGSHLCAACGDCVRVFDLKFDTQLQKIDVQASAVALFTNVIVAVDGENLHFREWSGLQKTTTRALIGTMSAGDREEVKVSLLPIDKNMECSLDGQVEMRASKMSVSSIRPVIDKILGGKAVPQAAKDDVIAKLDDVEYKDIRCVAMFHLSSTISFETVIEALNSEHWGNVLMLLKKLEVLSAEKIAMFIRGALAVVDVNEMVLAHFLTQPHDEKAADESAKLLSVDEVDQVLGFLARLIHSRRSWNELGVSLGSLDAAIKWGSRLITANLTALTVHGKTKGLVALRQELEEETERIAKASMCWSVMENMTEQKENPVPPSFMYIVERLEINLPE